MLYYFLLPIFVVIATAIIVRLLDKRKKEIELEKAKEAYEQVVAFINMYKQIIVKAEEYNVPAAKELSGLLHVNHFVQEGSFMTKNRVR